MAQGDSKGAGSKGAAPPLRGEHGFFHPASEAELIALVLMAAEQKLNCRVRGSAHSVSHAIYADPLSKIPNRTNWQKPTPGSGVEIMLDRYRELRVIDEGLKIVEVDAGIHLGADPSDPTGTATWPNSLLCKLDERGWMLSNLGGITRQTVSGFTATGSSGGSVKYSFNDDILGFRVIDAAGKVHVLSRDDPDPARRELFNAMVPNLGLLGVVSTLTLQCLDTYNVAGQESITTVDDCAIDLFGPGTADKPSLEAFLREVEYARLLWWPQRGVEKIEVWQAQRTAPQPGFRPHHYEEFSNHPALSEVAVSLIYTVLGNLGDLSRTSKQFDRTFDRAQQLLEKTAGIVRLGPFGKRLAKTICDTGQRAAECAVVPLKPWAGLIERAIPVFFPTVLAIFVKLDADKGGNEKGEPQSFHDHAWAGLPMDSEAEDQILPTGFTEMWVPLGRTEQVMRLLRRLLPGARVRARGLRPHGPLRVGAVRCQTDAVLDERRARGRRRRRVEGRRVPHRPVLVRRQRRRPDGDVLPAVLEPAARTRRAVPPALGQVPAELRPPRVELGQVLRRALSALAGLRQAPRPTRPRRDLSHQLLARPVRTLVSNRRPVPTAPTPCLTINPRLAMAGAEERDG